MSTEGKMTPEEAEALGLLPPQPQDAAAVEALRKKIRAFGDAIVSEGYADDTEPYEDPRTVAYEDFQESVRYSSAVEAVRGLKVDDVDAGPILRRDISLEEVVGKLAATDVAAEGIIHGFEAGFEYGARGGDGGRDALERFISHAEMMSSLLRPGSSSQDEWRRIVIEAKKFRISA